MRPIPAPDGNQNEERDAPGLHPGGFPRPTVSGMVTAGATVILLGVVSLGLLIPTVFYVVPIPRHADALTLCLPGLGPVQRFREGLAGTEEELAFIHEAAHAAQCRALGPAWYARQALTPHGRLTLEAKALCAEAAVLARRGADPSHLRAWTVETLADHYFDEDPLLPAEISAAVDDACRGTLGD